MKEPVDHILRPQLPWRSDSAITECGDDATKVPTITRAAYFARKKDLGQRRCAMLTCMTCVDTASGWATWDDEPRQAMQREIEWEGHGDYRWGRNKRGARLRDELLAMAALIEAHRDEFAAHINGTEQRRAWLEEKAALAAAKPTKAPWE